MYWTTCRLTGNFICYTASSLCAHMYGSLRFSCLIIYYYHWDTVYFLANSLSPPMQSFTLHSLVIKGKDFSHYFATKISFLKRCRRTWYMSKFWIPYFFVKEGPPSEISHCWLLHAGRRLEGLSSKQVYTKPQVLNILEHFNFALCIRWAVFKSKLTCQHLP